MDECIMAAVGAEAKELPAEIIMEMVLRLPVKSLVRFRCVSKAWFSLIKHPQFGQMHLNHHRNKLQSSILLRYPEFGCLVGDYTEENISEAMELGCPNINLEKFRTVGCCDGIICFYMDKGKAGSIVLWNPSIRESRTLSLPASGFRYIFPYKYGFGYDSLTNDYKFVRLHFDYKKLLHKKGFKFESYVFSLKTNSWRKIQHVPCKYLTKNKDAFHVNGGLYWRVIKEKRGIELLLRFDLGEETFSEVALPPNEFGNYTMWGLWGSSLCMLSNYSLWVLKEGEGWTKLMTIPQHPTRTCFEPLCFTGEVFITLDGSNFLMYESKKRTFQKLDIHGIGLKYRWFEKTVYIDSLISPGTDNAAELQRL